MFLKMIDFLMTAVKSAAQLIYVIIILGITAVGVQKLKSLFLKYQVYYGLSISSSNINLFFMLIVFLYLTTISGGEAFCMKKELVKLTAQYKEAALNKNTIEIIKLLCNHPFDTRELLENGTSLHKVLGGKPSVIQQMAKTNVPIKILYSSNFVTIPSESFLKVNSTLKLGEPCIPIGDWGFDIPAHQVYGDFALLPQDKEIQMISGKAFCSPYMENWSTQIFKTAPKATGIQILNGVPFFAQDLLLNFQESYPQNIELVSHRFLTDEEILQYIKIVETKFPTMNEFNSYLNSKIISPLKKGALFVT